MHQNTAGLMSDRAGETVGVRLSEARVARGYSHEDLAIATGLTEAEILSVEDGTSTNSLHLERIEHALA